MSCCGSLFRFLLGLINVIFLLIGIALVVTTSVLKWANISKLQEISGLDKLLNLTSIDAVTIALLCIGGFIVFLSFAGLIGVCCSNRGFLFIYEFITVILFMGQVGALIALLVMQPQIESQYKNSLNATVNSINTQASDAEQKCALMTALSELFTCCGANGPADFVSAKKCCMDMTVTTGCSQASIDSIKKYSIYLYVFSGVIIFIELISIIGVPFMIGRISRMKQ